AALDPKDKIFDSNPQHLLINFEDDVDHAAQMQISISGPNAFIKMPLDNDDTFGDDAHLSTSVANSSSLFDDITTAISMITTTNVDFITVQAAAAHGLLATLPYQSDEMLHLNYNLIGVGVKMSDFLADMSINDASTFHSSGKETALAIRRLVSI